MGTGSVVAGKVVDCTVLASTFPGAVANEVPRDAILNGIDDFFNSDIQLVTLEGKADIGKTRVLAQFAARHKEQCVSVFVRPNSWFTQDSSLLLSDLALQMNWSLNRTELANPHDVDESTVGHLAFDLQRAARRSATFVYFVIDGMEDLAEDNRQFAITLASILPFECSNFRFLLTGDGGWIPKNTIAKVIRKAYPIPGLSIQETIAFFRGHNLSAAQAEELYNACSRGRPGYLASAKRLLDAGLGIEELLNELPERLRNPFDLEWRAIGEGRKELAISAISILAHDSTPHSIAELSSLLNVPASELRGSLQLCGFLDVPEGDSHPVSFVSTSFRRFAAEKLIHKREETWELLATHFLRDQDSERALTLLPNYLEKTNRTHELLAVLSPTTFVRLIEKTDSFMPLRQHSALGLSTALKLNRPAEALRFGLQTSTVADISTFEVARAEVLARLAIDDYTTALGIAQGAILKHQRLQLLACIARYQKEKGLTPEATILEAIGLLVDQVDIKELQDHVVELGADLMYSRPDLALRLVSQLTPSTSDDRSVDWAFVQLSVLAEMNQSVAGQGMSKQADELRSKISDPAARRFSRAISLLVGNYTPEEILHHVETLDSPGDRIYLLRQWCTRTRKPGDAAKIIDYAVHLAIRATEYTPTARDFRDLAVPLPKLNDQHAISPLITAFDIQRESAKQSGPIQDYIQMQLLIAEAENRISPTRAGQRLLETYYDISELKQLEIKTVCTGMMLAALPKIDPSSAFKDSEDIKKITPDDFSRDVAELLSGTAGHHTVTRTIIEAIARSEPALALGIVRQLNTESRRDDALQDLVSELLELPIRDIPFDFLRSLIGRFSDPDEEDTMAKEVLVRIARVRDKNKLKEAVDNIKVFAARARDIVNPIEACEALSAASISLRKCEDQTLRSLQEGVEQSLENKWKSIDDVSAKLEAGYDIVVSLADNARELAHEYLAAADELKKTFVNFAGPTFVASLRLAIRSYAGLLPRKLEDSSDLERLSVQIERVPSRMLRSYLWSELALRCFRHNRTEEGRRIVVQRIRPTLDLLKEECRYEWVNSVAWAAAAMFEATPASALDYVHQLPQHWQDIAFERALHFKLTRVPPNEPYSNNNESNYHLDYDQCIDILQLVGFVNVDYTAYTYIDAVASSATWRHNRYDIPQTQRNQIAEKIREIAARQFPNARFIRHEGYAVLSEAQALRLSKAKWAQWEPILERARAIPNNADRALVLALVAEALPGGFNTEKIAIGKESKSIIDTIPAKVDRVDHLRTLADIAYDFDKQFAKLLLKEAIELLQGASGVDCDRARRNIVDSAYQIDPDLASSIASSLDSDEARRSARRRIAYQKIKQKLIDDSSPIEEAEEIDPDDINRLFSDLLGKLNAGRLPPREVSDTLSFIAIAGQHPLKLSFPILSWVIENAICRRAHADEAERLVRELFEAMLNSCEVAAAIICRAVGKKIQVQGARSFDTDRIIVAAGQRERALDHLRSWLKRYAKEYLRICDPYFGLTDLEALQLVLESTPAIEVTVITSRRQQNTVEWPWEETYSNYWKKHFSDQAPPKTEFVIVGGRTGDLPIHDRWWLTKGHGLRIGTSFNGLGENKDSEVSVLTDSELADREAQTLAYINREKREHLGEKLSYQFFEL